MTALIPLNVNSTITKKTTWSSLIIAKRSISQTFLQLGGKIDEFQP